MTLRRLAVVVVGVLAVAGVALAASQSHAVRFQLDQEGLPKDGYLEDRLLNSRTTGAGAVIVSRPLATSSLRIQRVVPRGRFLIEHVDTLAIETPSGAAGTRTTRLTLEGRSIWLTSFADGTRALSFMARVVASNDRECPVGSEGRMLISDDGRGLDAVRMELCAYEHEHYFERGLRGRLRVTIR